MIIRLDLVISIFFFKILALKRLTFRIVLLNKMRSLATIVFISLFLSFVLRVEREEPIPLPKMVLSRESAFLTQIPNIEKQAKPVSLCLESHAIDATATALT